jgi:hypothetical protein
MFVCSDCLPSQFIQVHVGFWRPSEKPVHTVPLELLWKKLRSALKDNDKEDHISNKTKRLLKPLHNLKNLAL